jgi:hypothetical protein
MPISVDAMDDPAEETRLRYLYRDLVLRGAIRLPLEGARALVGPDCAYHLYGRPNLGVGQDAVGGRDGPWRRRRDA